MNSKKCKLLRRDVEFQFGELPKLLYNDTLMKTIKVKSQELDENGKNKEILIHHTKRTLSNNCTRGKYQTMKKDILQAQHEPHGDN